MTLNEIYAYLVKQSQDSAPIVNSKFAIENVNTAFKVYELDSFSNCLSSYTDIFITLTAVTRNEKSLIQYVNSHHAVVYRTKEHSDIAIWYGSAVSSDQLGHYYSYAVINIKTSGVAVAKMGDDDEMTHIVQRLCKKEG